MKYGLYVISDAAVRTFNAPFALPLGPDCNPHVGALRLFTTAARDKESSVSRYPEDYELYFVGTYSAETGVISALSGPEYLTVGSAHVLPDSVQEPSSQM